MTALGVQLLEKATTANEILVDRAIRHAVFLERFKSGEVRRMLGFLNTKVFPDVVKQLSALEKIPGGFDSNRARRLQQTLASMRGTVSAGMKGAGIKLTKSMEKFALTEARWQVGAIRDAIPSQAALTIGFNTPSLATLSTIVGTRPLQGKTIVEWFKNVDAQAADKLRTQVGIGMMQGEALPALTKRVKGVMNVTRRSAEAVTRTTVNGIGANAREAAYADNSDIIKGVQWLSTLDDRTTLICAGLDGRVFKIGEGERPPAHVQCRSTTVPVLKGVSEGSAATRASMNGQVSAKTTYGKWLKKQPLKIQETVLGKTKAQLFRKGKIDITRFTDSKKSVLTLKQLEKVEARLAGKTIGPKPLKGSVSSLTKKAIPPKKFPDATPASIAKTVKPTPANVVKTAEKIVASPKFKPVVPSKLTPALDSKKLQAAVVKDQIETAALEISIGQHSSFASMTTKIQEFAKAMTSKNLTGAEFKLVQERVASLRALRTKLFPKPVPIEPSISTQILTEVDDILTAVNKGSAISSSADLDLAIAAFKGKFAKVPFELKSLVTKQVNKLRIIQKAKFLPVEVTGPAKIVQLEESGNQLLLIGKKKEGTKLFAEANTLISKETNNIAKAVKAFTTEAEYANAIQKLSNIKPQLSNSILQKNLAKSIKQLEDLKDVKFPPFKSELTTKTKEEAVAAIERANVRLKELGIASNAKTIHKVEALQNRNFLQEARAVIDQRFSEIVSKDLNLPLLERAIEEFRFLKTVLVGDSQTIAQMRVRIGKLADELEVFKSRRFLPLPEVAEFPGVQGVSTPHYQRVFPKATREQFAANPDNVWETKLRGWSSTVKSNPAEFDAIQNWTGSGYVNMRKIDKGLVMPGFPPSQLLKIRNQLKSIRSAMARAPQLTQEFSIRLFRGMGVRKAEGLLKFRVGNEFTNDALSSFSSSARTADQFKVGGGDLPSITLELKSSRSGVDIANVSTHRSELEWLVDKGARFRVVKVTKTPGSGTRAGNWNVLVEEVGV